MHTHTHAHTHTLTHTLTLTLTRTLSRAHSAATLHGNDIWTHTCIHAHTHTLTTHTFLIAPVHHKHKSYLMFESAMLYHIRVSHDHVMSDL